MRVFVVLSSSIQLILKSPSFKQKSIMHKEMYMKALMLYLLTWITAAYQPSNFSEMKPNSGGSVSSIIFTINGNVYPLGLYTVTIKIGNTPYVLDIDTGSDLTWVPSSGQGAVVPCNDPACIALGVNCKPSSSPCKYKTSYADGSSYTGTLHRDSFPLKLTNGKLVTPKLTFGCGIPKKDGHGVLGLGNGEPGILKQLSKQGVIKNVVGHCLSRQGGGFLYLGEYPTPSLRITWKSISKSAQHYSLGKANILMDNLVTDIKGLNIIFDSGSTYTYLASQPYGALLDLVTRNLNKLNIKRANDNTLPYCWTKPADDGRKYFYPLALDFTGNVRFEMPLKSYLIATTKGNVCLGILNGTAAGLQDKNVIGDISMQDKLVIYDNENGKIGWASVTTCKT